MCTYVQLHNLLLLKACMYAYLVGISTVQCVIPPSNLSFQSLISFYYLFHVHNKYKQAYLNNIGSIKYS